MNAESIIERAAPRAFRVKEVFGFSQSLIFLTAALLSIPHITNAAEINVPAGDSEALFAAISEANESVDLSIVRLNGGKDYLLDLSSAAPEPISTPIIIQGSGAHLVGAGAESYGPLFRVLEQGTLELLDLTIRDFRGNAGHSVQDASLISNSGFLFGRNLRFEHIRLRTDGVALSGVFTNRSRLELAQVRIVDVTVETTGDFVTIALYKWSTAGKCVDS